MKKDKAQLITPEDEEEFYIEADSWNKDVVESVKRSRAIWRWVAAASFLLMFMAVLTLAAITPLKTAVPYVIKVDQSTGIVEIIEPLKQSTVPQDEAITKYFIAKYLKNREQYNFQTVKQDYIAVQKMSIQNVFSKYAAKMNPSNKESPFNIYGKSTSVSISIRDIVFLDEHTALSHIKRNVNNGLREETSYWIITLTFEYVLDPATESDRYINPLGFQITSYRLDPEIVN